MFRECQSLSTTIMSSKTIAWLGAFCLGLIAWLYYDVSSIEIDYDLHSYLINASTGERMRPMDVVDLGKIIRPTNKYVNETNAMQRLFDTAQQINYENSVSIFHHYSDQRQLEQSGWPVANQTKCGQELDWIQSQLAAHKEYALLDGKLGQELTQLIDCFGKPEPGFYSGVLTWPGSYDLCKKTSLDGGRIKTRYCLAMMRPKWWPAVESGIPKTRIKIGICIPETCDSLSFDGQRDKIDALAKLELSEFLRANLVFESMFCLPDERSPIRQLPKGGRIFLALICTWLALILIATSIIGRLKYRNQQNKLQQCSPRLTISTKEQLAAHESFLVGGVSRASGRHEEPEVINGPNSDSEEVSANQMPALIRVINTLTIQHSWKMFKSNPFEEVRKRALEEGKKIRVDLAQLNFVKCVMAMAIVNCHAYVFVNFFAKSISNRIDISVGLFFYSGANLAKIVDTFFIMVGLLSTHTLLRKFRLEQLSNPLTWLLVNLGILTRLSPMYMLLYWYAKTITPYTSDGPWWDYGVFRYSLRGNCLQEPWWRSIPYFGRLGTQPYTTCQPANWFIVAVVQISLVTPLITYLLYKLKGHLSKFALLAFITLVSALQIALKVAQQSSIKGEAFGTHGAFLMQLMEKFESMGGFASIGRLSSVAYGCYVGYLLHLYDTGSGELKEWPRWLTSKTSLVLIGVAHCAVLALPAFGMAYLSYSQHETSQLEFVASYVASFIIWPVLNAMLGINLVSVYNNTRFCRAFSHPFWHTANKLGLALYLVHWDVLAYLTTSYQGGPSQGYLTDAFKLGFCALIFSLILSFLLTLFVDMPFTGLLRLLVDEITRTVSARHARAPKVPVNDALPRLSDSTHTASQILPRIK